MCTASLQIQVRIDVLSLKSTKKASKLEIVRISVFQSWNKIPSSTFLSSPDFYYKQEGESSQHFIFFFSKFLSWKNLKILKVEETILFLETSLAKYPNSSLISITFHTTEQNSSRPLPFYNKTHLLSSSQ